MDDFTFTPPPPTNPPEQPVQAGQPAPPARRRWPQIAAGAGVAAGLAVGAAALAGAATQPTAAPNQATPSTTAAPNPAPVPGPGHKGPRGGIGPGIHGEFTVPAPNGGYETLAHQVGTVSEVSSTSIKVKSEDGFEKTYVVDENTVVNAGRDGIANVKQGDNVRLVAVVADNTAKAVQMNDVTTLGQHRGTWAPKGRRGPAGGSGTTG